MIDVELLRKSWTFAAKIPSPPKDLTDILSNPNGQKFHEVSATVNRKQKNIEIIILSNIGIEYNAV